MAPRKGNALFWGEVHSAYFQTSSATVLVPVFTISVYSPSSRWRNVTICPRVQGAAGLNLVLEVPLVIPWATAQQTASW